MYGPAWCQRALSTKSDMFGWEIRSQIHTSKQKYPEKNSFDFFIRTYSAAPYLVASGVEGNRVGVRVGHLQFETRLFIAKGFREIDWVRPNIEQWRWTRARWFFCFSVRLNKVHACPCSECQEVHIAKWLFAYKTPFLSFCVQNSHECTCSTTYFRAEMEFYTLLAFWR